MSAPALGLADSLGIVLPYLLIAYAPVAGYRLATRCFAGGEASAQGDVAYRTKVYYDTRNVERLSDGDRTFVNLRFGWKPSSGDWEFGVFGRNVFDETNISDIIPIEGLGFDLFSMGARPTYGAFLRYDY